MEHVLSLYKMVHTFFHFYREREAREMLKERKANGERMVWVNKSREREEREDDIKSQRAPMGDVEAGRAFAVFFTNACITFSFYLSFLLSFLLLSIILCPIVSIACMFLLTPFN